MIFEKFKVNIHNTKEVATLVYDVDYRTFDIFYKNKEDAILAIERNLTKNYNYESNFFIVLDDNKKIIGMFIVYINKKHSLVKEAINLFKHLRFKDAFKLFLVEFLDSFVLSDIRNQDVYLAQIAISKSERGKGLGKEVITNIIKMSKEKGFNRLILDVDFRNSSAKNLYESLGFKVFDKKNFKFFNFERGMTNMEFLLK